MITAKEAKMNVINYEITLYDKIKIIVDDTLKAMSKSIEFHSQNGFDSLEFVPYNKSQFSSEKAMQIASNIFEKTLKDNGFKIIRNDWKNNLLKITW